MEQFEIVPMNIAHLDEVAAIERESFSRPWSRKLLMEELSNPTAVYYAVLENGQVVGYIGMHVVLDEGYIANVAVRGDKRGRGIGKKLLETVLAYAQEYLLSFLTLEVRISNIPAISLYRQYGFTPRGARRDYYDAPRENALIMTRELRGQKADGGSERGGHTHADFGN